MIFFLFLSDTENKEDKMAAVQKKREPLLAGVCDECHDYDDRREDSDFNYFRYILKRPCPDNSHSHEWDERDLILLNLSYNGHLECINARLAAEFHTESKLRHCLLKTALCVAVCYDHSDCVELIIKAGALIDDDILRKTGENGNERCVNLLLEAGGDPGIILCAAAHCGRCETQFFPQDQLEVKEFAMMLSAAGETVDETKVTVPDYLKPSEEINLKNICRKTIRKYLLQINQVNLVYKVSKLPLPCAMTSYLLYDVNLDYEG